MSDELLGLAGLVLLLGIVVWNVWAYRWNSARNHGYRLGQRDGYAAALREAEGNDDTPPAN